MGRYHWDSTFHRKLALHEPLKPNLALKNIQKTPTFEIYFSWKKRPSPQIVQKIIVESIALPPAYYVSGAN
tara:strand:- start:379 stop:591 length:213 start_codon:yes stop_codon:yes gene_type:complete